VALALIACSFAFATANRSQPITITLGIVTWRGQAVYAILAAGLLGLLAMFLLGLPADLRARSERQQLDRKARTLERELDHERSLHRIPPPPPALMSAGVHNREERDAV
jgi:TRAP-type C4-dicarboxylate transport system permease small subunit